MTHGPPEILPGHQPGFDQAMIPPNFYQKPLLASPFTSIPHFQSGRLDVFLPAKPLAAGVAKFQEFCSRCFFLVAMGFFKGAKMKCVGGKGGGDLPTNWEYLKKKCTFKEVIFEFYKIYGVSMVPYFFHQWKNSAMKIIILVNSFGWKLESFGGVLVLGGSSLLVSG